MLYIWWLLQNAMLFLISLHVYSITFHIYYVDMPLLLTYLLSMIYSKWQWMVVLFHAVLLLIFSQELFEAHDRKPISAKSELLSQFRLAIKDLFT